MRKKDRDNKVHVNKYPTRRDPEMMATTAVKKAGPRHNVIPVMQRLCPNHWEWDNKLALSLGTADAGYYMVSSMSHVHVLSPEEAGDLYLYHNYDKNRNFDQTHAERLSTQMSVAVQIAIAIPPSNYPVVVNGQHTLWAMYMSGKHMQAQITVYMCRDEDSLAALYGIFDSNKRRSPQDILMAYIGAGALVINYPASRHHRWSQCVACAENDFNPPKSRVTNAEKAEKAQRDEVVKFAKWVEQHIEAANQAKLITQGVGAAFYAMYNADEIRATEFLKLYITGQNLTQDHLVLVLRNRMTINKPPHEHAASAARVHAEIAYTCWNKFCRGEVLKSTRQTRALPKWNAWRIYLSPRESNDVLTEMEL